MERSALNGWLGEEEEGVSILSRSKRADGEDGEEDDGVFMSLRKSREEVVLLLSSLRAAELKARVLDCVRRMEIGLTCGRIRLPAVRRSIVGLEYEVSMLPSETSRITHTLGTW
jgi:hypothetical protein